MSDESECRCGTECGNPSQEQIDKADMFWQMPKRNIFGLVEKWPNGTWSVWCPKWAQPIVFWVLRRLG